jgi:hypothetical protein
LGGKMSGRTGRIYLDGSNVCALSKRDIGVWLQWSEQLVNSKAVR